MTFRCPECGSDQVTSQHHQTFMLNTGDHYCHSVKTHHSDSPSTCLAKGCDWRGFVGDLKEDVPPPKKPTVREELAAAKQEIATLKAALKKPKR